MVIISDESTSDDHLIYCPRRTAGNDCRPSLVVFCQGGHVVVRIFFETGELKIRIFFETSELKIRIFFKLGELKMKLVRE